MPPFKGLQGGTSRMFRFRVRGLCRYVAGAFPPIPHEVQVVTNRLGVHLKRELLLHFIRELSGVPRTVLLEFLLQKRPHFLGDLQRISGWCSISQTLMP